MPMKFELRDNGEADQLRELNFSTYQLNFEL
jgi:hypothetical protein